MSGFVHELRTRQRQRSALPSISIELLIVIVVVLVLLLVSLPTYLGFVSRANSTAARANVRSAIPAVEAYFLLSGGLVRGTRSAVARGIQFGCEAERPRHDCRSKQTATTYCVSATVGGEDVVQGRSEGAHDDRALLSQAGGAGVPDLPAAVHRVGVCPWLFRWRSVLPAVTRTRMATISAPSAAILWPPPPVPCWRSGRSCPCCSAILSGSRAASEAADPEDVDKMLSASGNGARPDRGARRGGGQFALGDDKLTS